MFADTKYSTIKRDAPLPPLPPPDTSPPLGSQQLPKATVVESGRSFRKSSSSSAELNFLSQQLAQFDSTPPTSPEREKDYEDLYSTEKLRLDTTAPFEKEMMSSPIAFPDPGSTEVIAQPPLSSPPASIGGLKRATSISHPKVQIPRYVRQSFSSRPVDIPGSPSTAAGNRPTSPTNSVPSISFAVEAQSPTEEKPARMLPKVALRRSDTLPKYPPEPEKKSSVDEVIGVESLPSNPKVWTPTHVGIYLTHVLKLVPKPLVQDVKAYVISSSMGGRTFLRMKESDLRELGINQNWVRIISSAREKLRREVLAGKIWGAEEVDDGLEEDKSGKNQGLGVPEAKDTWQKSWRKLKGKSRGRVKGMAKELEVTQAEDRLESESNARAEEARKAIAQGWKERRRRKKKTTNTATPSDEPEPESSTHSTYSHTQDASVSSVGSNSSDISIEDASGSLERVSRRRTESNASFSSVDSASESEVSVSSIELSDVEEMGEKGRMGSRFANKPLEGIDFAFDASTPTEEKKQDLNLKREGGIEKEIEDKDVESMNSLPPALAALLSDSTSTSNTSSRKGSLAKSNQQPEWDFDLPDKTGSYQSRFLNHQSSGVNPYEKIPQNPRKRSSLFIGSGFSKGSIRGLPGGGKGTGRFTVEELIEMDPELAGIKENDEIPFANDDNTTMKKVTGKEENNAAGGEEGKTKTISISKASSIKTGPPGTLGKRHHIKDIFGPLVEVPVSELDEQDLPSIKEDVAKEERSQSLDVLEDRLEKDKNGSVMLVRKSHLRQLEAKLAELENQLAHTPSVSEPSSPPPTDDSQTHKRTDSATSNGEDLVALVPAETASRYSSVRSRKDVKEWYLAQADADEHATDTELEDPIQPSSPTTEVQKKRELNMGWSELGSFCLAASAGIGVVIGQVVFSKLLKR